jgi:hypothetical protein
MTLAQNLKKASAQQKKPTAPVWAGPESNAPNGGITFSLLSRFLCCRERFRLLVIEGLKPQDTFNHKIEYGLLWHCCEEEFAKEHFTELDKYQRQFGKLAEYAQSLCKRYPAQQEQVDKWYNVCKTQFPIYIRYWEQNPDVTSRIPLLQEQVFNVSYQLPSGRTVYLRGKWDSVDLIGKGKDVGIWLQENKSKGDVRPDQMQRQLTFDLQTMLYIIALGEYDLAALTEERNLQVNLPNPVKGVRYNVIRRPLSGGVGTIRQHQPSKSNPRGESAEDYYARLGGIIQESPQEFFWRWKVTILPSDIEKFKRECLNPILEQLCDWYGFVTTPDPAPEEYGYGLNWRMPYGVYNALLEGGQTELDEYMLTGSTVGLVRDATLFGELQ